MIDSDEVLHGLRINSEHEAADLIEQLQHRNAELDIECEARQRYTCRLLTERNELAAHVERLRELTTIAYEQSEEVEEILRASGGRNHHLMADQIKDWAEYVEKTLESTPQQSLNALKRDVARDAYNQAIFDLWDKICTEGMSGKDVVCWGENSATQYANTKYPTEGE